MIRRYWPEATIVTFIAVALSWMGRDVWRWWVAR